MSLRVTLATDSADPSGVGEHLLTLGGALCAAGHEVQLVLGDHAAGAALADRARRAGLVAEVTQDWAAALDAPADVIHVHAGIGWEGHALTGAAPEGVAVVRTEHLPWLLTDPDQIAEYRDALPRVDAVIAVSRAAAQGWRRAPADWHPPLVAAVANGIAPPVAVVMAGVPAGAGLVILCVGRFTPQKRHRVLLGALARLRRQGMTPPRLWLAGAGEGQARVERWAARLGLDVAFLGRRDDVPALMAAADVLALPSAFEGLPLVVLEAMALGLPVVATRIGGTTEALGPDHPWLTGPSSRAFAAALADALARSAKRDEIAAAQAARQAQHFNAARMAADTVHIYRAAMARRNGNRMDHIRLGFIGAGGIAHRHFGVLETMGDVRIVAVTDPDQGRAEEAARRTGARAFADHETMLAETELDAVFICVPPFAHGDAERACLAKRLPFFVEKPLSLDLALAEEIAAEVEDAGLITAVGYHWRYLDVMDQARAHLEANPAHLMQGFWIDQTPPPQWWWRQDQSGGQVVEQATHIIDAARFLAGDVTTVYGVAARRDREAFQGLDVPTATAAVLTFKSGAVANLAATCLLRWNHRVGLHVFADGMAMEITDRDIMVDVGHGRPVRGAQGDPVWRQDRDFVEAVMGRANGIRCPYPEALETHRIALAVSQSAASGQPVNTEVPRSSPRPIFRHASA